MADDSMDAILQQARQLGNLIREDPRYRRLREADARVRDDKGAAEALDAYNRAASAIQEKEQKGQPVEPEEKRDLEKHRDAVVANETIKSFSEAQVNYADMMHRMNEAIFQSIAGQDQPTEAGGDGEGGSRIVTPG